MPCRRSPVLLALLATLISTVTVTVSKLRRVCPKAAATKGCRTAARRIGAGRYRVVVQAVSGAARASRTLALGVVARG